MRARRTRLAGLSLLSRETPMAQALLVVLGMKTIALLSGAALAVAFIAISEPARAAGACDSTCGPFEFDSSGALSCEAEFSGGCEVDCTPINFSLACDGECNVTIDASCQASCEGTCNGSCDPGKLPDCEASCQADCEGRCMGACTGGTCAGDCQASCQGNCHASCSGGQAPSCDVACKAQCDGSCRGSVDATCQAMCQASLTGGCKAQCSAPSGAIFCNGQYVSASDVGACIECLATSFDIHVSGSIQCSGNQCTAQASCTACSVGGDGGTNAPLALAMAGLAICAASMRRRARADNRTAKAA